jgi:predicted pyridoxine 5'-phosphate oxidase superfamily flavin-nucleotide-binding protein
MDFHPLNAWLGATGPFPDASIKIQRTIGVEARLEAQGRRAITPYLTEQHRAFFAQLPYVAAGALDASGQPWATLLTGQPGFMASCDSACLSITGRPPIGDPLATAFNVGAPVGLLGIDLATRRRNRVNGTVKAADATRFALRVEQAFGNCPKYIQRRMLDQCPVVPGDSVLLQRSSLDGHARKTIGAADTFFIATTNTDTPTAEGLSRGVDVSHRGGRPGFIKIVNDQTLMIPDFIGNFHFRTLGNLTTEPRAGLLFPDFSTGDLLYLAVDAEILWNDPEIGRYAGAQRLLKLHIRELRRVTNALTIRFETADPSPFVAPTGIWSEVAPA